MKTGVESGLWLIGSHMISSVGNTTTTAPLLSVYAYYGSNLLKDSILLRSHQIHLIAIISGFSIRDTLKVM